MRSPRLLVVLAFVSAVPAQARLLRDIGFTPHSSNPLSLDFELGERSGVRRFAVVGKWAYFAATTPATGTELFRTDGTAAGTGLVADLTTAPHTASRPSHPAVLGSKLFFLVGSPGLGKLYVTDAVTNATRLVHAGPVSRPRAFGSAVFFGVGGSLWSSDGTAAGTKATDLKGRSRYQPLAVYKNELYFAALTAATGSELYRTDGTEKGTHLVRDVVTGPVWSLPRDAAVANGLLFFVAESGFGGELWRTDGTTNGTVRVAARSAAEFPDSLTAAQGRLYFRATTKAAGREMFWTDGTAVHVIDALPGSGFSNPSHPMALGRGLVFAAFGQDPKSRQWIGRDLFHFDGSALRGYDLLRGGDSYPKSHALLGSSLMVGTNEGLFAIGTGGVREIGDLGRVDNLTVLGGRLVFAATRDHEREPWISDGTAAGTKMLRDLVPGADYTKSASPDALFSTGRELWIRSFFQPAWWRSDGTTAGTQRVVPRVADLGRDAFYWDGKVIAQEYYLHDRLYVFDTKKETIVELLANGRTPRDVERYTLFRGKVWFVASIAGTRKLCCTDGSRLDVVRTIPGSYFVHRGTMVVFRGALYFPGRPGTLWRSDGTAAGTVEVQGIQLHGQGAPRHLTVLGDRLLFAGKSTANGADDLFVSDGTAANTKPLGLASKITIVPGRKRTGLAVTDYKLELATANGRVFFVADSKLNQSGGGFSGRAYFASDGTAKGTVALAVAARSPVLASTGERAVFESTAGVQVSDGTVAGTTLHAGVFTVHEMMPVGERVFFWSSQTLMSTDGTNLVTWNTGSVRPSVGVWAAMGGDLYFVGETAATGTEVFAVRIGAYAHSVVAGCSASEVPQLTIDRPVLGRTLNLSVRGAKGRRAGFFGVGVPSNPWVLIGGACQTVLDYGRPTLSIGFTPSASGTWSMRATLPNDRSLIGLLVPAQAALGPTPNPPIGLDWTNGLHLHLDRK